MTDKKITDLTAITGADTASGDEFAIVDVSDPTMDASGTTKKITRDELGKISTPSAGVLVDLTLGPFTINFDDANINTLAGVTLFTPAVGDLHFGVVTIQHDLWVVDSGSARLCLGTLQDANTPYSYSGDVPGFLMDLALTDPDDRTGDMSLQASSQPIRSGLWFGNGNIESLNTTMEVLHAVPLCVNVLNSQELSPYPLDNPTAGKTDLYLLIATNNPTYYLTGQHL